MQNFDLLTDNEYVKKKKSLGILLIPAKSNYDVKVLEHKVH